MRAPNKHKVRASERRRQGAKGKHRGEDIKERPKATQSACGKGRDKWRRRMQSTRTMRMQESKKVKYVCARPKT